ncbi:MAG TPA: glycine zipper 2TM domain-containing protein [Rhodocyclaceae bacterium]|nr:glycine zipper 2TM domain-containing protein [Rhodocyclaceae bacterium]
MKTNRIFALLVGTSAALILGGCETAGTPRYGATEPTHQVAGAPTVYPGTGVVQSIELVQQGGDRGPGLGAIAGAVIGGVAGSQVGSGSGRTAATILGAAGGAYVGHTMENRQQQTTDAYKVTVRMDDGSHQALLIGTDASFRVGDRVRIENGVLYRW